MPEAALRSLRGASPFFKIAKYMQYCEVTNSERGAILSSFFGPRPRFISMKRLCAAAGLCIFIALGARADSGGVKQPPRRFVSADSAEIAQPRALATLDGKKTLFRIAPRCEVDSATLLVRYYRKTDTLTTLSSAPYQAEWEYSTVPDQDQLYLQFGYILFHVAGDTIVCPPLPHRWAIDRNERLSSKKYRCREIDSSGQLVIDGALDDWRRLKAARLGEDATFRCVWTPKDYFVAVEVRDAEVTPGDHVEIMFDMHMTRETFAGIEHRIISVGPKRRRFTWAPLLHDTASVQSDSVLVRFDEEMEWRGRLTSDGYRIECRMPFVILGSVAFPPKQFGFDIAVIDRDYDGRGSVSVWSGAAASARHNPSEWGAVILQQRMPTLKALLIALAVIMAVIIASILVLLVRQKQRDFQQRMADRAAYSPLTRQALEAIETADNLRELTCEEVAARTGARAEELRSSLEREIGASFEQLLDHARVKKARGLLRDPEIALENVAELSGFGSWHSFEQSFADKADVTPEQYRKIKLQELQEEQEEEEEENREAHS